MDKKYLISEINKLIESKQLWGEMADHLVAFGGDLFETKYVEAYFYHEELVFNLIKELRGYEEFDEYEFEFFSDAIWDLSKKQLVSFPEETDEEPGYKVIYISNAEELLNCHLNWIPSKNKIFA